jgi:hypothetical protein
LKVPAGFGKRYRETEQPRGSHRAPDRLHRPPTQLTVAYIDTHKDTFGVEPICTTLQFAPSTYYAAKSRPPSPRAVRDAILMPLAAGVVNR